MKRLFVTIICVLLCTTLCGCNRTVLDTTYKYDYAIVALPNGEMVEGPVDSWKDFTDGDQLQITINGTTYLTSTTRAVLVKEAAHGQ